MRYEIDSFARGVRFRLTRKLPTVSAIETFPDIRHVDVRLKAFANAFGNVKWNELLILCAVAKARASRRLFEFGTFDGLTAWHLLANTPEDSRITTLDLPLDHPARAFTEHDRAVGKIHGVQVGKWLADRPIRDRVDQVLIDSMDFDCTPYERTIDFCFIDASHEYKHVKRDTENALRMIRQGGVIFWHDYSRWWPGVQKVLDDLSSSMPVCRIANTSLGCLSIPHA